MLAILEKPEMLRHAVPLSVAAYERMAELGLVDEKTELVRGVIFEKITKAPLHQVLLGMMSDILRTVLPEGFHVRSEGPLSLADSTPEPDIAVVSGSRPRYFVHHPATARFIIEISISSEALDREKAAVYAEAGVEEYWIVLPDRAVIERFTQLGGGGYARHEVVPSCQATASLTFPAFAVNLSGLLAES